MQQHHTGCCEQNESLPACYNRLYQTVCRLSGLGGCLVGRFVCFGFGFWGFYVCVLLLFFVCLFKVISCYSDKEAYYYFITVQIFSSLVKVVWHSCLNDFWLPTFNCLSRNISMPLTCFWILMNLMLLLFGTRAWRELLMCCDETFCCGKLGQNWGIWISVSINMSIEPCFDICNILSKAFLHCAIT